MSPVVFFDLPSKQRTAWSLNPWKTRMVLNYKKIEYKTEWIEYPDLAPKLKSLGVPPNDPSDPGYYAAYSSPAIKLADDTYMLDSWPIAHELEKRYPAPSLHLDDPIVEKVRNHISTIMQPLTGFVIPKVPLKILNERSAAYFNETRKQKFGMPLSEVEKTTMTEENWEKARRQVKQVGEWLRERGGPYFLGETVSYADFIFVGMLAMIKRLDDELFRRFLDFDEALPQLFEASKQWLEKDD
ncbi:hypothetical protein BDU57DRAFT_517833 [Ampelomyces quisqualis]|uniref:GST N-terminal domain-containing protein n=1 Tax=Ampelomyces quisqualis TaxID=50730 RepID=A0A6A5QI32_AMPQU|nr:hypothetical protein BDU57DRAFT_517833 [Ampelomyces quisqualis]